MDYDGQQMGTDHIQPFNDIDWTAEWRLIVSAASR